jgi:hypothetical protein
MITNRANGLLATWALIPFGFDETQDSDIALGGLAPTRDGWVAPLAAIPVPIVEQPPAPSIETPADLLLGAASRAEAVASGPSLPPVAAVASALSPPPVATAFPVVTTRVNTPTGSGWQAANTTPSPVVQSGSGTTPITYMQYVTYSGLLGLFAAGSLIVSDATVASAAALQTSTKVGAFAIADTASNVLAGLSTLGADTKLSSIALTGGTVLAVSYAQYQADVSLLGKLAAGDTVSVSGAAMAGAGALQGSAKVSAFSVTDTVADVTAGIAALGKDSKLSSITLSGGTSVTVTYAQYLANRAALDKLAVGDTVVVTGVTAAGAATVSADSHVRSLTVSDTLADIGTSMGSLESLAAGGRLTGIAVTDSARNLSLTSAQYTADQAAIGLMTGTFTVTHPVINLIWDASVANAPAGFVAAVEDAANYFDALITSAITVNIDIGHGEYDAKPLPAGMLGETQILNSDYITTAQFMADLAKLPSTPAVQSALASLSSPGEPASVFVEGGDAKALGATAAYGTQVDAAVGFALDPTGRMFNYNPNDRALLGQVDFIGLAEAEIGHALGRVSLAGIASAVDLYRYSSAGVIGVAGSSPTYFSVNGGSTKLDSFATSLDYGDWAPSAGNDAVAAIVPTGVENLFSATDVTELNVLGYGISAHAASGAAVIPASAASGLNAASLTFIGSPVTVTMGSTNATATAAIAPAAGIEEIAGFSYGTDRLVVDLSDLSGSLRAFDTAVGGVHAIALAGSNDLANGVVLVGVPTADTAANLLAHHLTLSGSTAMIA